MAAKKTKRGPRGTRSNSKSAFIRSQPESLSAKEVVEAGNAAGLSFTDAYVWSIRGSAKRAGKTSGRAKAKLVRKGVAARPSPAGESGPLLPGGSLESQFAALAVELGISRAEAILRRVREVLEKLTF